MFDDFNEKLARLVVEYAVKIEKKDKVMIRGPAHAEDLIREIYLQTVKAGGHVVLQNILLPGLDEILYTYGSDEQLTYVDPIQEQLAKTITKSISIYGSDNTRGLTNIDPEKKTMRAKANKEVREILFARAAKGDMSWTLCPYPSYAFAQEANMGNYEYKEFVYKALALDKKDPVTHWQSVEKKQDKIVAILDKGKEFRIVGDDTDISFGIEGRKWINCCGHENLPDGEVFTAPIEDSVNGKIRFTYPGIYFGQEIEDIRLEFKDGKVVKADASKGKAILDKVLELENADILGELAVGTNYGIQKFTKNMLFDEKMGGTVHLALGMGYPESGSKNKSSIHWDILKDMKSAESKIYLDGEVIYQKGKWLIG
jgi:aminopeptidase